MATTAFLRPPLAFLLVGAALAVSEVAPAQDRGNELLVGTSGTLITASKGQEAAALATLQDFIKDETGFTDRIVKQKTWEQLAAKLAKGELQIGVFQGHEFAWAREKYPKLRVLALAVNTHTYPVAYVVVRRDSGIKDFAGLEGQPIELADNGKPYLRLFLDHESHKTNGKAAAAFFKQIKSQENAEIAIDDVVDGVAKAAVADRAALEAYKRRKPGRFAKIKDASHSQAFPPPVVVYHDSALDANTLQRFREGLLNANRKERGETILTLFGLTGFEPVPSGFEQIVSETRKAYPPPTEAK